MKFCENVKSHWSELEPTRSWRGFVKFWREQMCVYLMFWSGILQGRSLEDEPFSWQLLKLYIMSGKTTPLSSPLCVCHEPNEQRLFKCYSELEKQNPGEMLQTFRKSVLKMHPCMRTRPYSSEGRMLVSVTWLAVSAASRPVAIKPRAVAQCVRAQSEQGPWHSAGFRGHTRSFHCWNLPKKS